MFGLGQTGVGEMFFVPLVGGVERRRGQTAVVERGSWRLRGLRGPERSKGSSAKAEGGGGPRGGGWYRGREWSDGIKGIPIPV